ncbi:SusC/RagA family TonB-linked outer membrane protein [Polaribacter haliotis]|uniref:SusC/RagA family TonB-linked outer membrane protein n=1 Tax=Polaribacter haliotis TaxID=1888915 RepID=A0A7L8AJ39_9FLAO|nr:SusC/RagA family TonB-linked outer membrane protein [Polaribacter haliotis]QOD61819.1 SusC/RagA family TonB-linked outer membrane protein [Polaribacter haliotis]
MKKMYLLFIGICFLAITNTVAQNKTIKGTVVDEFSVPIPGVNILEKGTLNGVSTDFDGNYTINTKESAVLVFSYIGYKTLEVTVSNQQEINVTLKEDASQLDEIVIVGYGTQKRQEVTGSVAVADLKTYKDVPVNNILETVKGTVAGLNVGSINSAGAVASLSIRGQNSVGAGNGPLIVLDGVVYNGSLSDVPTNDIESFTVLKDASAAAVYGSRSANGVILIQTKRGRGKDGKPLFSVNVTTGVTKELNRLDLYDGPGYLQRVLDMRADAGLDADPNLINTYLTDIERENYEATPNHTPTLSQPFDPFIRTGFSTKADLSISNSTEKSNYYISASVTDQQGVVLNDNFKNLTGRINLNSDLTDWFTLGVKTSYSFRDFSGISPPLDQATSLSPYASLYEEDGTTPVFFPQTTTSLRNPLLFIPTSDRDFRNNLTGLVSGVFKIPGIEGLKYTVNFSNSLRWSENNVFYNEKTVQGLSPRGTGSRSYSRTSDQLLDNIINYNRTFDKHRINLTLLHSKESTKYESVNASGSGFDNSVLGDYKLEDAQNQSVSTGGGEYGGVGQMARLNYTYDDKYSLTGTFRRDGFSGFSKNKKYGNFYSVGANWNIYKESFLNNSNVLSALSLKASYGSTGNQAINPYQTLAKVATSKFVYAGDNSYTVTQRISSLAQNNLGWEKTTGLNLRLDFGFFNDRISGYVEGYKTQTNDLIFNLGLPAASGAGSILSNIGQIDNKGLEIALSTINVDKEDFRWTSDFAFSLNRNKVVSILGEDNDGDGVEDDLINSGYFIGKTLGTVYWYENQGIYQQSDVDNGTILDGMRPGDYILEDVDSDGRITSDKDRQFLGDTNPNFRWSLTNTLKYKKFSLLTYFYSIWGGNGHFLSNSDTPYFDFTAGRRDLNHPVYDYWTPTNTNAYYPRPGYRNTARYRASKYVDRSFIKLQKVALSYDMSEIVKPIGLQGLRLTLSGDNLFTYAPHWKGLDPETNQGNTWTSRPSLRTYLLTCSFNF